MVMARKQTLANKRRSQKHSNKKRARTIRSMRQVNGGAKGISGLFDILGRSADKSFKELKKPFLKPDILQSVVEDGLQPLIVPPVSSKLSSDLEEEEEDTFDNKLRSLLVCHVTSRFDDTSEKNIDRIINFIFDPNNRKIVLHSFIEHIKYLYGKNILILKNNNITINSITSDIEKLMKYAKELDIYNLFLELQNHFIVYISEDQLILSFKNQSEAAFIIGNMTFIDIFKDNDVNIDSNTIPESEFLRKHVDVIKEHLDISAGGSKGKKKGKMRRPKSRTRKL
jgi:hypothetical protein